MTDQNQTVADEAAQPARLDGTAKLAVEMGPLAAFLIGFFFHGSLALPTDRLLSTDFFNYEGRELYLAVLYSLPAFALAVGYSLWKTRRVAPMLLFTTILVTVLGALTFIFQSKTFVYMKPTIVYGLISSVLAGGLLTGRVFLRMLFDGAIEMPERAWRIFTWRFVAFNAIAAIANEILWRTLTAGCVPDQKCDGDATWALIETFGFTGAYLVFVLAHAPFFMKNLTGEAAEKAGLKGPEEG